MDTKYEISFDSHSMFPQHKNEPSEHDALAMYSTILDTIVNYAKEKGFTLEDVETSNVNEEMCMRRIGNFGYGYAHRIIAKTSGTSPFKMSARIEAFNYIDYSKSGDLIITVSGEDDLVTRVNESVKSIKPLTPAQESDLKAKFTGGKMRCYGHCKRD